MTRQVITLAGTSSLGPDNWSRTCRLSDCSCSLHDGCLLFLCVECSRGMRSQVRNAGSSQLRKEQSTIVPSPSFDDFQDCRRHTGLVLSWAWFELTSIHTRSQLKTHQSCRPRRNHPSAASLLAARPRRIQKLFQPLYPSP